MVEFNIPETMHAGVVLVIVLNTYLAQFNVYGTSHIHRREPPKSRSVYIMLYRL